MSTPRVRWSRVVLVSVPVAFAGALLASYAADLFRPAPSTHRTRIEQGGTPMMYPGIERPPTASAGEVALDDDEDVIGVLVNGHPRAYRVKAMRGMTSHLVNDLIDDVPVSVSYCDRTDCAQVFTAQSRGSALELWVGGYSQQLLLKCEAGFFYQPSGKMVDPNRAYQQPYPTYPFERLPWKTWRTAYPATEVYLGVK